MKLYLKIQIVFLVLSLGAHLLLEAAGKIDSIGWWYLLLSAGVYSVVISLIVYFLVRAIK